MNFLTHCIFFNPIRAADMVLAVSDIHEDSRPTLIPTESLPYSECLYVDHEGNTHRFLLDEQGATHVGQYKATQAFAH